MKQLHELRKSYFFQITFIIIIILALVISSLAFSADRVTVSRAEELAKEQFDYAIDDSIENIESRIGKLYEDLVYLGAYVGNEPWIEERIRTGYLNQRTSFTSIFYYDARQDSFKWYSERQVSSSIIKRDPKFMEVLTASGRELYMSDPIMISGDMGTFLYVPVIEDNRPVGIFGGSISVLNSDLYRRSLESANDDMILYLLDNQGEVLTTSFNLVTDAERRVSREVIDETLGRNTRTILSTDEDTLMYEPDARVSGWSMLAKHQNDSVYETVYDTRWQYLMIALVTFFLSILVGLLLSRTLTNPLVELVNRIKKQQSLGTISLERTGSKEVETLLDTYNDYAQRMETSRREQLSQQQLILHQEKLASLGQLAAGIAHEIRNPLTPVHITLQMVREGQGSKDMVDVAIKELERANSLISTMLTLAKPDQAGKYEEWINMIDFTKRLEFLMDAECYKRPTKWELLVPNDMPPFYASFDMLVQIIYNLFKNAVDAVETEGAEGSVVVTILFTEQEYRFLIEDNGIGMSEEQLKMFGSAFHTTKESGNGLGIYMIQEYLKSVNGMMEIDSSFGKGTAILIKIPRRRPS
ncbi:MULTISPECIES: HAMP domain-containing sensor histidine kinase [unclassified Exiguobacterium]|uniref:sensor histidine kinase n=1 Tax=unclassified Exiguobacterium TaxID=2644629 RepID=UPI002036FA94|nr:MULTISPECIES: HAMP domain-containing sensor histidine kinase [unclassified Exiguobacterium]